MAKLSGNNLKYLVPKCLHLSHLCDGKTLLAQRVIMTGNLEKS